MDVSAIATAATQMSQDRTALAVSTSILRKALDLQGQGALQLVLAATQSMPATSNPPNLGNSIDVLA
jgi:hypothetical protein